MSEAYENFARETYGTVYNTVRENIAAANGAPLLVVSGEDHYDPLIEKVTNLWTDDAQESPAHAAAYTHIAAIRSAVELAGRQNVVVSFEQDPARLGDILANMDRGLIPDFVLDPGPGQQALLYAYDNGLTIVGTDAGYAGALERADGDRNELVMDPQRYAMEIAALSAQAENAKVVVHIGGAAHIMTLQGYPPDSDFSDPDSAPARVDNPFEGVYGRTVFFNSDDELKREDGITAFYRDPENAIQIDAPGQMDASDRREVAERINQAAQEIRESAPAPDAAPQPRGPAI